jgi:hypothetical protein
MNSASSQFCAVKIVCQMYAIPARYPRGYDIRLNAQINPICLLFVRTIPSVVIRDDRHGPAAPARHGRTHSSSPGASSAAGVRLTLRDRQAWMRTPTAASTPTPPATRRATRDPHRSSERRPTRWPPTGHRPRPQHRRPGDVHRLHRLGHQGLGRREPPAGRHPRPATLPAVRLQQLARERSRPPARCGGGHVRASTGVHNASAQIRKPNAATLRSVRP